MLKGLFKKKTKNESNFNFLHSVGVYFNDHRMCFVALKSDYQNIFLQRYDSLLIDDGIVINSKIQDIDRLSECLVKLAVKFSRYSSQIVLPVQQSLVTIENFHFNTEFEESLESEVEYRASKIANLDEINYDYYLFSEDTVNQNNNVILTVAKNEDVGSREYLAELSDLTLKYTDVETIARVNAFSYWINNNAPDLEKTIIAIFDVDENSTQVLFCQAGTILFFGDINQGVDQLLRQLPELTENTDTSLFESVDDTNFEINPIDNLVLEIRQRLAQEIYRSIRVFYSQNDIEENEISRIFITGIGANKYHIEEMVEDITHIKTEIVNPLTSVITNDSNLNGGDTDGLTVAFGLALRGLL